MPKKTTPSASTQDKSTQSSQEVVDTIKQAPESNPTFESANEEQKEVEQPTMKEKKDTGKEKQTLDQTTHHAKEADEAKPAHSCKKCCHCNFGVFAATCASVFVKVTAAMLAAASCILAALTAIVSLPAAIKIVYLVYSWHPGWIVCMALAVLALPPIAAASLYASVKLMRKTIATVNAGGYALEAEQAFRFACCPDRKPKDKM